jgi:hypothetical protein
MTRIATISLAIATLAATAGTASAYDYGYGYDRGNRIDRRQERQLDRIYRANQAGELTWYERQRLLNEQARIARLERWAKSDGHISRREARVIEQAQDDANRHIRRESRDWDRPRYR